MDILFLVLLISNIFFIVYCRLMIDHYQRADGDRRPGLAMVLSMPTSTGLNAAGLRYWRRYWLAVCAMVVIVIAGALWRYPHIIAGLAG